MARVHKVGHDSWKARSALQEKAEAAQLALPSAMIEIRLALGMSQAEFAKAFRMTQRRVSDLENGRGNPGLKTLDRVGRALGLRVGFVPKVR
jgi:putative transcriptional regulator